MKNKEKKFLQKSSLSLLLKQALSLLFLGEDLGLEGVGSGEVDGDLVGGDLVVDLGHGLNLGLNLFLVEGVKEYLNVLLTVKGNSGGLASDGGGVALFNNKLDIPL